MPDEKGKPETASADALERLFSQCKDTVKCVLFNSCFSKHQATAIKKHIPHVIGMNSSITDEDAIRFSTGFYKAIGAGKDVPFAFEMGKTAIAFGGGEVDIPILL